MEMINKLLELDFVAEPTTDYLNEYANATDLRYSISPKIDSSDFTKSIPAYFQVFGKPEDFHPDLSILDLMFNMGLGSLGYLRSCLE